MGVVVLRIGVWLGGADGDRRYQSGDCRKLIAMGSGRGAKLTQVMPSGVGVRMVAVYRVRGN